VCSLGHAGSNTGDKIEETEKEESRAGRGKISRTLIGGKKQLIIENRGLGVFAC